MDPSAFVTDPDPNEYQSQYSEHFKKKCISDPQNNMNEKKGVNVYRNIFIRDIKYISYK